MPFQLKTCLPSLIISLAMLVINSPSKLYIFAETNSCPLLVMGIFISLLNGFGYAFSTLKSFAIMSSVIVFKTVSNVIDSILNPP